MTTLNNIKMEKIPDSGETVSVSNVKNVVSVTADVNLENN